MKLLNSQFYIDNLLDYDLIVIVPKFLSWMVPKEVYNIIEVNISLRKGYLWINGFNDFIKKFLKDYKEILLSKAYSHPHPKNYDISRFVGLEPFNEEKIKADELKITYIWRNDRLIFNNKLGFRISNKFNIGLLKKFYIWKQKKYIENLYIELNKNFNKVDFAVVGPGGEFEFAKGIIDLRFEKINEEVDKRWCERYSVSQIVVGVHGSNMLLPSGLSGSTIEILPEDRLGNFLQDILFDTNDIRDTLYRYRFVNDTISPYRLSKHITSLVKSYPSFRKDMVKNCH